MKKILLSIFSMAALFGSTQAQTVTTLSGKPQVQGWNATTTVNTGVEYWDPYGIVVDEFDRVWITEKGEASRVRVYDPALGNVYTKTGSALNPANPGNVDYMNATGINAKYDDPHGIAYDVNNNCFYIADYNNHVIRKVTGVGTNVGTAQVVTTFAGQAPGGGATTPGYTDGTGSAARFYHPTDVAVDAAGNVYVADEYNECVRKITSGGAVTLLAGSNAGSQGDINGTGSAARFNTIKSIAILDANHIVVVDSWNHKIKKINTSTGAVTTICGTTQGNEDGNFTDAKFRFPTGVEVDAFGNIYVSEGDGQSNIIRQINMQNQTVKTIAGMYQDPTQFRNGQDTNSRFYKPAHMAFNTAKNELYVIDNGNYMVRKIDLKPVADLSATPASTNVNIEVQLNDLSVNEPTSWSWSITPADFTYVGGTSATSQNPKVKFSKAATYTVTLTATNIYGTSTKTRSNYINISAVTVTSPPIADFSADKTNGNPGTVSKFTDLSTNQPASWKWTFTPATGITYMNSTTFTSQHPEVRFDNAGVYTVKLEATNSLGTNAKTKVFYIEIRNVGMEELMAESLINVFPNPSTGLVSLSGGEDPLMKDLQISVTDVQGRQIQSAKNVDLTSDYTLHLENQAKGIYFIRIKGEKFAIHRKVVVQ